MAEVGYGPVLSVGLVVLAAVLGAALALGGGIIVETWRGNRDDKRKLALLKGLLQQEISTINLTFSNTIATIRESKIFPMALARSIRETRRGFDRNREWALLIENGLLREDIFGYYTLVDLVLFALEEVQSLAGLGAIGLLEENHPDFADRFFKQAGAINDLGESILRRLDEL